MRRRPAISAAEARLVGDTALFDAEWYAARHPDVVMSGLDPLTHFLWLGYRIGRDPSSRFSLSAYCEANPDVRTAGINPLVHYLRSGQQEGRLMRPTPSGDTDACHRLLQSHRQDWDWRAQKALAAPAAAQGHLVSIIMPTFNRAARISAAISSALGQSHGNFELIIVDDGSEDDTASVVAQFQDRRIIYTANRRSKGVSGARNTGLDLARGDWVFFLDSDNTWHSQMLATMLAHARTSGSSAGYCAVHVQDDAGQGKYVLYADFDYESCLRGNFIDLNGFFLRWQGPLAAHRFDETLQRLVDWDYILRIAATTRLTGLPWVGVNYYDGSEARITNRIGTAKTQTRELIERVRNASAELALRAPVVADAAAGRIAAVLHVYHPDLLAECLECLAHLDSLGEPFDLFVTTSLAADHPALAQLRARHPAARILVFPNLGADIGPFLELISTLKPYALVLKIHTKRDVAPWGGAWRRGLMQPILGTQDRVRDILELFRADDRLMMACAADFYKHGLRNTPAASMTQLVPLAERAGLGRRLRQGSADWGFVAGTMFWIRPQALLPLVPLVRQLRGYRGGYQADGALEHGLERLLGLTLGQQEGARIARISIRGEVTQGHPSEGMSHEHVDRTMQRLGSG
ncbi:glycosyltransferase [Salipiger sp. 1_MG-2023]|uniref:glycosyltransferase n=1 Tax=Salipiger sp. 1_MG-2023 TaxID=3062665 RepID=UPI0026E39403|nr:glycosyltransferase [Salipiger sp. 1_MG-2023]MDO6586864.1 glycosyltransferase [Salipiger sp. 1_MG-2023]